MCGLGSCDASEQLVARGSWLVAAVLFGAAVAKLLSTKPITESALTEPFPDYVFSLLPWLEMGLAMWLIAGICRFGSWLTVTALFVTFTVHLLLLILAEQPNCGCLGDVTLSPIYSLIEDGAVLALLAAVRPAWTGWPHIDSASRSLLIAWGTPALLVLAVVGWSILHFGSIEAAISVARGDQLTLTSQTLSLGRVAAGATVVSVLQVRNNTDEFVQIAMVSSSCNCTELPDLPVTISPGGTASIPIVVTTSSNLGEFRRVGRLHSSVGVFSYTITAVLVSPLSESVP